MRLLRCWLNGLLLGNPQEMVIVLDDPHTIEKQSLHETLRDLMQASSPQIHFVMISRARPLLSINCFRVRRQLT